MTNLWTAERIKALRRKHRWAQPILAYKLGVSPQAINRWETGTYKPNAENAAKLDQLEAETEHEQQQLQEAWRADWKAKIDAAIASKKEQTA